MTLYSFSLSKDFQNGMLNEEQLRFELLEEAAFEGVDVTDVGRSGDDVRVVTNVELNETQLSALSNVIAAHVAIQEFVNTRTLACIVPRASKYKNTTFTRCGSMIYQGTIKVRPISSFQIVSYMDDGVTSYSFRVVDLTHKQVITEGTFTNTTEAICAMSSISNLSYKKATLEFQVMKTGGKNGQQMYIDSITIFT
jgi:hypothetical protein